MMPIISYHVAPYTTYPARRMGSSCSSPTRQQQSPAAMRQLYALPPPQLQPSLSSNAVASSSPSIPKRRRHLNKMPLKKKPPKLKRLTSRVLQLTRRRQLHLAIFFSLKIINSFYLQEIIFWNWKFVRVDFWGEWDCEPRALEAEHDSDERCHWSFAFIAEKLTRCLKFDQTSKSDDCSVDSVTYGTVLKVNFVVTLTFW